MKKQPVGRCAQFSPFAVNTRHQSYMPSVEKQRRYFFATHAGDSGADEQKANPLLRSIFFDILQRNGHVIH